MRTRRDRIRHAVSFEVIGILLVVPLGSLTFGINPLDMGVITIAGATIASLWNYAYNVLFDRAMLRLKGHVHKTFALRVLHAILFEVGLLVFTLPMMALYLGVGLWQALVLDLAFVIFYLVYAFVFNLAYDMLFPIPTHATG